MYGGIICAHTRVASSIKNTAAIQTFTLKIVLGVIFIKAECYHYLFDAALKLHQLGLDPADPKHGPLTRTQALPQASASKGATSKVIYTALWGQHYGVLVHDSVKY